jgi:hypothetical protein
MIIQPIMAVGRCAMPNPLWLHAHAIASADVQLYLLYAAR